jgi:hypothetical protein
LQEETNLGLQDSYGNAGPFITRRVDELLHHPSYVRNHLTLPVANLSAFAEQREDAFREPVVITRECFVIDGYALLELARRQRRPTLLCIEFDLDETEGLQWLLLKSRQSNALNAFSRILLAMDLQLGLQERARSNQRAGGQNKGSSKLTEAERLDVRCEVALVAGVSVGNVTKVKQLVASVRPEILDALRSGEIRIHRAWKWSKAPLEEQQEKLRRHRIESGLKKTARMLVSRHRPETSQGTADQLTPTVVDLENLVKQMSSPEFCKIGPVAMAVIEAPGQAIFLTKELFQALNSQQESLPLC